MNFSYVISFLCNLIFIFTVIQCEKITLEKISSLYIPSTYTPTGAPVYSLEGGAAEQSAYDPSDKFVYIMGKKNSSFKMSCTVQWIYFFLQNLISHAILCYI